MSKVVWAGADHWVAERLEVPKPDALAEFGRAYVNDGYHNQWSAAID
jgi:hypothetical protein